VPPELSNFVALDDPSTSSRSSDVMDRSQFGSRAQTGSNRRDRDRADKNDRAPREERERAKLPPPSETAYKVTKKEDLGCREQELQRVVQSLLNKICPENVKKISSQIAATNVASTSELKIVIGLIMKKSLSEPHYCETYADLVYMLKAEMPEFPSPDGGKPVSFKSTLLNVCQNEFESMPSSMEASKEEAEKYDPEELEFIRKQRKNRVLANMKFIGHLFLRQLLTAKIIGSVIEDLSMCSQADVLPAEHVVECLCELLTSIGYTLESMPAGATALKQVCGRLMDLKTRKENGKYVYGKRIQFGIQDLLDTRSRGWERKVFKTSAKTKDEIRQAQESDMKAATTGGAASEKVIAGQRPAYLTEGRNPGSDAKADGLWQEVPKARKGR